MAAGVEEGVKVHLGCTYAPLSSCVYVCACTMRFLTRARYAASIVSGLVVTTAMNPFDVVSTRLYSQKVVNGRGELYSGVFDCLAKTFRAEGLRGFYKGWAAHYFRLGPHTVCTFVFWEQAKKVAADHGF